MKVFISQVTSFAVFLLGLNLAISNNQFRFDLDGWPHFGVSVVAAMLMSAGMVVYVRNTNK